MVTRAYLLTHPNDVIAVPRASLATPGGYYSAAYRVSWDSASAEWHIALTKLAR
jgi:hypothetical protein